MLLGSRYIQDQHSTIPPLSPSGEDKRKFRLIKLLVAGQNGTNSFLKVRFYFYAFSFKLKTNSYSIGYSAKYSECQLLRQMFVRKLLIFKLADRMHSMRTNGASKNPDSCRYSVSKLFSIRIIFGTYFSTNFSDEF